MNAFACRHDINKPHSMETALDHTLSVKKRHDINILVAEDNIVNQKVISKILEKLGYKAVVVANGIEAVSSLEHNKYDIVLMDIQMPEMDGFEATMRIRNSSSGITNHNIPIIAMTAHAMKGDKERCLEAGMDDYISKPIQPKDLVDVIERNIIWVESHEDRPNNELLSSVSGDCDIFDRSNLLKRLDGDKELVKEVLDAYLKDATDQIEILKYAFTGKNLSLLQSQAHTFKGASLNVCAGIMGKLAFQIETYASENVLDEIGPCIIRINEELKRFRDVANADIG